MSWLRRTAAVAAAALLALCAAPPVLAKPPVWVVRSDRATLVLFGSIHLLPPGLDWRPPLLDDALAKADELWLELPLDAATDAAASAATLSRGLLPQPRTLSSLLSLADAARLRDAALAVHFPAERLERMQPWLAELTLSMAQDTQTGASALSGVDEEVQAIAPASVRRRAFETAPQQIGFLAGTPLADQIASLDLTIDEIDHDPSIYRRIIDEWMAGDLDGLDHDALATQRLASPAIYDRLITRRNRRWANTLAERLRKPGLVVVVVGVGHLVGPGGVPALLRARGLAVQGP